MQTLKNKTNKPFMRSFIAFILFIVIQSTSIAQLSSTIFPLEHKKSLDKNLSEKIWKPGKKTKRSNSSIYLIDLLKKSTQVLYGSALQQYLNKVGQPLIDEFSKKSGVKIYPLLSTYPNAFSSDREIFISIALLSKLENEAQLAYLICRQIAHINLAHNIDRIYFGPTIDRYASRQELIRNTFFIDYLNSNKLYSEVQNQDADAKGLNYYLKSAYEPKGAATFFDVLRTCTYPKGQFSISSEYFKKKGIQLPSYYFLDQKPSFDLLEAEFSSIRFHENISARQKFIADRIDSDATKHSYLNEPAEFSALIQMASQELCYRYLEKFKFHEAIFLAEHLLTQQPDNLFLNKIIVKAFCSLSILKNYQLGYNIHAIEYSSRDINIKALKKDEYLKVTGPLKQSYYFTEAMEPRKLTALAAKICWDLYQQHPEDDELKSLTEDIFNNLMFHFKEKSFFILYQEHIINTNPSEFERFIFFNCMNKQELLNMMDKSIENVRKAEKRVAFYNSYEGRKKLAQDRKKGATALGIDRVITLPTYFFELDPYKELDFEMSSYQAYRVDSLLRSNARIAKLDLLSPLANNANDPDLFNIKMKLEDWIKQKNKLGSNIFITAYDQSAINEIIQKYRTKFLLFNLIISSQTGNKEWMLLSVLFDLESGRFQTIKDDYFKAGLSNTYLNAQLFDVLHQIKQPRI